MPRYSQPSRTASSSIPTPVQRLTIFAMGESTLGFAPIFPALPECCFGGLRIALHDRTVEQLLPERLATIGQFFCPITPLDDFCDVLLGRVRDPLAAAHLRQHAA